MQRANNSLKKQKPPRVFSISRISRGYAVKRLKYFRITRPPLQIGDYFQFAQACPQAINSGLPLYADIVYSGKDFYKRFRYILE